MDPSKSTQSQKEARSPSMITDYFRGSKPNHHVQKGKLALKKDHPSSVYLTPESSPGSHSNSESPHKENSHKVNDTIPSRADQELESGLKPSCVTDGSDSSPPHVSTSNDKTRDECDRETKRDGDNSRVSLVKSAVPCSDSPQSPQRCNHEEEVNSPDHDKALPCRSSKSSSPAIIAFQSFNGKEISSPPCLPRLKLRKSCRSNSQADAAAATKDGEPLKPKPGRRKKKETETAKNSVITDYFQVRRSGRQTKSEIEKEKQHQLEQMILSGCEDGLEVKEFDNKGRGVVATKAFKKGDFVVEYAGDLIDIAMAREREEKYAKNPEIGCYMYYFKCGSKQYCVDATAESGKLGRLLNHSSKDGNCCTRSLEVKGTARLILVAKRDISDGEELTYDYGDRSKASLESHPWLKL